MPRHVMHTAAAPAAAFTLLLVLTMAPASIKADFVGFETGWGVRHGCYPASFSSNPTGLAEGAMDLVYADPPQACAASLSNADEVAGKAVLVDRGSCAFTTKWAAALGAGAGAIIVANNNPGEMPFEMAASYYEESRATIPACLTWQQSGATLRTQLEAGQSVRVDFSSTFSVYRAASEPLPTNLVTALAVSSPADLRWEYPVAQATFNPSPWDGRSGPVVVAEFTPDCSYPPADNEQCLRCWAADRVFENQSEMNDAIVLFRLTTGSRTPGCFFGFHELLYPAQMAGARGAIFSDAVDGALFTVAPYLVPFDAQIPMFVMLDAHASLWDDAITAHGEDVVVVLPDLEDRSGPDYFLLVDDEGALPDTEIELVAPSSATLVAGQALFNPQTHAGVTQQVVLADFIPDCALPDGAAADGNFGPSGADCQACHDAIVAGTALSTPAGSISGQIALVPSEDSFCLHSFQQITDVLEAAGAVGVLVGNECDLTVSLIKSALADGDSPPSIPTYNIRKDDRDALVGHLDDGAIVTVRLPALIDGAAPAAAGYTPPDHGSELASVRVQQPAVVAGAYDVAQALFSPLNTDRVTGRFIAADMAFGCDSSVGQCHLCEASCGANPFGHVSAFEDDPPTVLAVDVASAQCLRPLYNYVLAAQELNAKAVLFIAADNMLAELGPATIPGSDARAAVDIPSFLISRDLGDALAAQDAGSVFLTLPAVSNGAAEPAIPVILTEVNGREVSPHDITGERDIGKANLGLIVGLSIAGAVVVGAFGGYGIYKWRRQRRLAAYNTLDQGVGPDRPMEDEAFTAIGLGGDTVDGAGDGGGGGLSRADGLRTLTAREYSAAGVGSSAAGTGTGTGVGAGSDSPNAGGDTVRGFGKIPVAEGDDDDDDDGGGGGGGVGVGTDAAGSLAGGKVMVVRAGPGGGGRRGSGASGGGGGGDRPGRRGSNGRRGSGHMVLSSVDV